MALQSQPLWADTPQLGLTALKQDYHSDTNLKSFGVSSDTDLLLFHWHWGKNEESGDTEGFYGPPERQLRPWRQSEIDGIPVEEANQTKIGSKHGCLSYPIRSRRERGEESKAVLGSAKTKNITW